MRPSRQELIRRRRRSSFVGRSIELAAFRDNLDRDPEHDAFQYLFHVHGQAGVGKSSLVRQWEIVAREQGAATAYLDDDTHSVVEAMEAISVQFARQGIVLKRFDRQLALYYQQCHEEEAAAGARLGETGSGPLDAPRVSSTMAAQVSLAGLGLLPGVGAVTGAIDPQHVARGADRLRTSISARFRTHSDAQLVLSPLRTLTPVFLTDLADAAERRRWLVLFFDVIEQTGPLLNEWLRDVLIAEEYGELPNNVLAVLSGQGALDARCWRDYLDLMAEVPLDVFTEDEARRMLATRGVVSEEVVQVVLQLTGRLPVLVDTLAQNRPQNVNEIDDPSDTAVERFLKWISDVQQRDIACSCSLPLHLDEDIYRTMAPETQADQYAWLRNLPFVAGSPGRSRYHDVVRASMIRLHRTQSPARWRQQQNDLADVYRQRCRTCESALPFNVYWRDAEWREHKLHETYHRLCASPAEALPDSLHEVVLASEQGVAVVRRWAQMLLQAGHDADSPALTGWGQRISTASAEPEDSSSIICILTKLMSASELPTEGRALAYTLRASERRAARHYDEALDDYATSLALVPGRCRAFSGIGETQRLAGRYEQALVSFTRALDIIPDDIDSITRRGFTYLLMGREEEALADYNRAIEINPEYSWPIASRGETYRFMRRYDEALIDLTRALELSPNYAWPRASRAEVYWRLGRNEAALADLDHVIGNGSDDGLRYFRRGDVHRAMGRFSDALADFTRALELNPQEAWILCRRGDTFRSMGHYDDALNDLARAIECKPENGWFHLRYAIVLRLLDRAESHHHLQRAADIFSRKASVSGAGLVHAHGNLVVVYCATQSWDKADEELERFLACTPRTSRIIEALNDLNDLQEALTLNSSRIQALQERLNALAGPTA
ncbi:tetratricopeptide repeat protein [Streptomyces sp. HUAS 31]|uniref:tetratricopeptide repeat protein n=1 Tax=Streptomyces sp. HUAS 31 TaxID=3020055 RepID=UPI0023055180|nr:tetratricopeptide repeat protein [Streptomyces sp. HUAS 31]WCD95340.1 tetratricopeptide repeat protein [Streptomyces sp. HUAS 31]